jgi:iron complex outermembrane receptor protein
MNDLFWSPGGNTRLENEYAWIYELTYAMKHKFSVPVTLVYDISLFRNSIKDMIQWHPGEYSYWTADNIKNVNTKGLEASLSLSLSKPKLKSFIKLMYSFTRATTSSSDRTDDTSLGKQLTYIPVNKANAVFSLSYGNIYGSWISDLTGKRYTTADNSSSMPAYFINNTIAGIKLKKGGNSLNISILVDNLFNVTYQTIAYYPLPGRSFQFKLHLQFLKP